MSEQEEFLARWTRLKQESRSESQPEPAEMPRGENGHSSAPPPAETAAGPCTPLPTLESINAQSDMAPFLQLGVPPELVRAALRSAWTVDQTIRDFIGIAETQWDFNDPGAMPGFGPLASMPSAHSVVTPSVSLLDSALGTGSKPPEFLNPNRDGQVDKVWLSSSMENQAPRKPQETIGTAVRRENEGAKPRRHGSALPK
jgi:hypothetical protein